MLLLAKKGTSMHRPKGFTLIEMLITVAIVGILAAFALPTYTTYVTQGKITEAVAGLAGMKVKMEQHFQDNRTYVGACQTGTVAPLPSPNNAKYFNFSCPVLNSTQYTVQADGYGSMAGFSYTIDQSDNRVTLAVPAGWTLTTTCWVIKKDGSC
jgi:type IV pilus assembly protein PilE